MSEKVFGHGRKEVNAANELCLARANEDIVNNAACYFMDILRRRLWTIKHLLSLGPDTTPGFFSLNDWSKSMLKFTKVKLPLPVLLNSRSFSE